MRPRQFETLCACLSCAMTRYTVLTIVIGVMIDPSSAEQPVGRLAPTTADRQRIDIAARIFR